MGLFSEYRKVSLLLKKKHQVVVYAESRHYYPYFEKLITDLLYTNGITISYITSDKKDPLLKQAPAGIAVTYCKWMLGFLFRQLRANVVIMTMPDLGNYFLKRSDGVEHYVYIFHAAVSTHLQYRKHAFDHYDIILCTGEYQVREIRKAEELYQLPAKQLIPYGYPLLDKLRIGLTSRPAGEKPTILLAPSWFSGCIFETCIEELLQELSRLPFSILIRYHPEYVKRYPVRFRRMQKEIAAYPNIRTDTATDVIHSLLAADILITDRSGIAFEFAFGVDKPVLFIDTGLKQTNPDWNELGIEPVENRYRKMMGVAIQPSQLNLLANKIQELKKMQGDGFHEHLQEEGGTLFYNSEMNYQAAASAIKNLITGG